MTTSDRDQLRRLEAVADAQLAHLDHDELLAELLDRVRDVLEADTVVVLVVDDDRQQLVAHAARGLEEEVRRRVRIRLGHGFAGRVAVEQAPVLLDHVGPDVVVNPLLWKHGLRTLLGVPLLNAGELVGVMHLGRLSDRQFTEADVEVAQAAADRVAVTIHGSRAAADRTAAKILQRGLVPTSLPSIAGFEFAGGYVPAAEFGIGGDWYDAFELPDGRVGLAIGDVVGNGLHAAMTMSRLRSMLRAYAVELDSPASVLARLDRAVVHFEPAAMATVGYGVVDPAAATFTVALAGHLPPVIARPGAAAELMAVRPGAPIGARVDNPPTDATIADLTEETTIVLYTDGLVERRTAPITDGLDRLRRAAFAGPADDVCHAIVDALLGEDHPTDDTALLITRCHRG